MQGTPLDQKGSPAHRVGNNNNHMIYRTLDRQQDPILKMENLQHKIALLGSTTDVL